MTDLHSFYQAENYPMGNSVGYLVKQLAQTVGKELDRRMVDLGLTDAQWKPLLLLQQGGCTTAVDLSRIACHDAGSVTRLLDRLEAKGLVQRVRSAEDRRVVNLELTEEGKKVAAQVPEIIAGLGNEVLKGFSRDEFDQFTNLLTRALANARAVSEGDPTCA
jgi:DNA-binding MarR family transcriptional regulator